MIRDPRGTKPYPNNDTFKTIIAILVNQQSSTWNETTIAKLLFHRKMKKFVRLL